MSRLTMRPSVVATLRRKGKAAADATPGDFRAYREALTYARRMFKPQHVDDAVRAAEHNERIPLSWVRFNIP